MVTVKGRNIQSVTVFTSQIENNESTGVISKYLLTRRGLDHEKGR